MYNARKRQHKVKYEFVVLSNVLIGDWFGPAPGRAHDSHVLAQSDLVLLLRTMRDRLETPIYVNGDHAYHKSDVILRAPKGTNLTPAFGRVCVVRVPLLENRGMGLWENGRALAFCDECVTYNDGVACDK